MKRTSRLPVDRAFGIKTESVDERSYTEYVSDLREKISDAFEKVQKNANLSREKQKRNYDLRAKAARLLAGDRVLVKVLAHEGKHKLADEWTADIYIVVDQPNVDIPVYRVKREDGQGPVKTLHRNNLFHLGSSLLDESQNTGNSVLESDDKSDKEKMSPVPLPRRQKQILKLCRTKQKNDKERSRNLHNFSDSEEEMVITEIATGTPSSASVVVDEDGIIVDETTHHTSSKSKSEIEEE